MLKEQLVKKLISANVTTHNFISQGCGLIPCEQLDASPSN